MKLFIIITKKSQDNSKVIWCFPTSVTNFNLTGLSHTRCVTMEFLWKRSFPSLQKTQFANSYHLKNMLGRKRSDVKKIYLTQFLMN